MNSSPVIITIVNGRCLELGHVEREPERLSGQEERVEGGQVGGWWTRKGASSKIPPLCLVCTND